MYHFATWKYWLVIIVLLLGTIFALPNIYGRDPALQFSRTDRQPMDAAGEQRVRGIVEAKGVKINGDYLQNDRLTVRFASNDDQLKAREAIQAEAGRDYTAALSSASRMPDWMRKLGLKPMSLGLDLRGGVHFVYEVDVQGAITQTLGTIERNVRTTLRDQRIPYVSVAAEQGMLRVVLRDAADLDKAVKAITPSDSSLTIQTQTSADGPVITATLTEAALKAQQDSAVEKNITTMRNRVQELGISENPVSRQGANRIMVELADIQDPNEALRVLGATATLEFRLVDESNDAYEADRTKRVPLASKLYKMRDGGTPILLKRDIIASGEQLTNAASTYQDGTPAVKVSLDARAGAEMLKTTTQNIGRRMGVVYIERKRLAAGESCDGVRSGDDCTEEKVINAATIRGVFSSEFVITGLQATEAKELALLLRAGSLAAPLTLIEQRVVGPSLGQDNIDRGVRAMLLGLVLTFIFMAVYYRAFGWVANAVLFANLVLTVGLLSLLGASLSLPGIAAVVFHLGIAVDANILIYERIREELRNGNSPLASINAGFEKAFATIADSNVTTLIAGVVLFSIGTGTIHSFAIVMTIGILTSLFTSVVGSRALVHFVWGRRRRLDRLSI